MSFLFKEGRRTTRSRSGSRRKDDWTGVKNALAQKHLRSVRKGDRIFFYHTGDEKAVVGIAKAAGARTPTRRTRGKLYAVDIVRSRNCGAPSRSPRSRRNPSSRFPLVRHLPPLRHARQRQEWSEIEKLASS